MISNQEMLNLSPFSTEQKVQETFQNSEEFNSKAKARYKIEAKNSKLKHRRGYDVATSEGLVEFKYM